MHHTDAVREYAYDYPSPVGQLKRALDEAPQRGWTVVNMKSDWKTIFPPKRPKSVRPGALSQIRWNETISCSLPLARDQSVDAVRI